MPKPPSVIVFGVLNLVFGVLGVCGLGVSVVGTFMAQPGANPVMDLMRSSVVLTLWTYASTGLGGILVVASILSGVGLLMEKAWGRTLALAYGVGSLVVAALSLVMNAVFLFPGLYALTQSSSPEVAAPAWGGLGGGIAGICFSPVYPLLLMFFMTRKPVVEFFARPR